MFATQNKQWIFSSLTKQLIPRKPVLNFFLWSEWPSQTQFNDSRRMAEWGWQSIQNLFVLMGVCAQGQCARQHGSIVLLAAGGYWVPALLSISTPPTTGTLLFLHKTHTSRGFWSAAHFEENKIGGESRSFFMSQVVLADHRKLVCLSPYKTGNKRKFKTPTPSYILAS